MLPNSSFKPTSPLNSSSTSSNSPSYFDLTCPYCKSKNISITNISPHPTTKSYSILIHCPLCNTYKSYELQTYFTYISQNTIHPKPSHKCFKHSTINSSIYCKNCNIHMCSICHSYHSAFEPNHIIINHKTASNMNNESHICPDHCEHSLDFYCENCNVNLCSECGHKEHCGHNVIQLREYWEKVNSNLIFKSIDEISNYFDKEIRNYDCFINEQVYNLEKVILYFQNLKILIEKNHIVKMKNNKMLYKIIESLFEEFYQCRYCPRFNAIQNIERIKIGVFIDKQEYKMFFKGMNCLKNDFDYLAKIHSDIFKKLLFTQVDIGLKNKTQFIGKEKYSERNQCYEKEMILGRKQQREGDKGGNGYNTIEENFSTNDTTINDNVVGSNNNNNIINYEQNTLSKRNQLRINTGPNNTNNMHNSDEYQQHYHSSKDFVLNNVAIEFTKGNCKGEINVRESKESGNVKENVDMNKNKKQKPQPKVFTFDPVVCEKYLHSLYASLHDENINSLDKNCECNNNNNTSMFLFDNNIQSDGEVSNTGERIENGIQLDKIENNALYQRMQQYKTNNQHQHKTPD